MHGAHIAWPLGPQQHELVTELASLIARGGAWRFLHAPVVRPNLEDFPDPWHEDRAGVARVVARTLWHAYLDLEPVIEDVRSPDARSTKRLRSTNVRLTSVTDTRAVFEVSSIGNDDVAGEVSHQVGRAFVGWLGQTGHPFRTSEDGVPALAFGSLATIYLGLGVVATNSAHYDRSAGEIRGSLSRHEHGIAHAGGLEWQELAFLLAVQATVRDDVLTALDALRPSQAEEVAAWRELLDDHEAELVELLGLDDVASEPATRGAAPRTPTMTGAIDERDLHKQNYGQRVFRVRGTRGNVGGALGIASGAVVGTAVAVGVGVLAVLPIAITVACIGGVLFGRRVHYFRCASCRAFVKETDAECHMCGGRIHSTIANASDRLDREEELEQAERAKTP